MHNLVSNDVSLPGGHCKLSWKTVSAVCQQLGVEQASARADLFLAQLPAIKEVVEKEGIECDFTLRRAFDVFYDKAVADTTRKTFDQYKERIPYSQQVDFVSDKYLEQV